MQDLIPVGFGDRATTNMTHLQGFVETTYKTLCEAFGEPNARGDEYKTDAEWNIITPDGVATIYNYKNGRNYNGEEGLDVEDITYWHIGGHTPEVTKHILATLKPLEE